MKKISAVAPAVFLFGCAFPARAVDSLSVEYGTGNHAVHLWRVGLQWKQPPAEWMVRHRRWSWYWDASFGGWKSDTGTVHDLGLTPVFRYAKANEGAYVEGAIGLHLLSDAHISSDLGFSTRFQFGDHVGAGYKRDKYDWQVRLQHLSNGGMRNPNPGINFLAVRLQYELR